MSPAIEFVIPVYARAALRPCATPLKHWSSDTAHRSDSYSHEDPV